MRRSIHFFRVDDLIAWNSGLWPTAIPLRNSNPCLHWYANTRNKEIVVNRTGVYYIYCAITFDQITEESQNSVGFKITATSNGETVRKVIAQVEIPFNTTVLEQLQKGGRYKFSRSSYTGRLIELYKGSKVAVLSLTGAQIKNNPDVTYFGMYMVFSHRAAGQSGWTPAINPKSKKGRGKTVLLQFVGVTVLY